MMRSSSSSSSSSSVAVAFVVAVTFVVASTSFVAPVKGYYTANVIVYNLLNTTLQYGGCYASVNGTIPVKPSNIEPQQVGRLFITTTQNWEDVSGVCWWKTAGAPPCDPNKPPAPATSCPYIAWQRVVVAGQEDIQWDIETPGHFGIGDVSITKRVGHQSKQYCICSADDEQNCQSMCADI
eukprot:m.88820 g.88820  ORF g.88820 m.88820 type:complete len:181 (+) comp8816_c5_seq1:1323-1865(+)